MTVNLLVGCADAGSLQSVTLEEVARYGAGTDETEVTRRDSVGILGASNGFVQGRDSTLYVLDRYYKRVWAYAPSGELKSVIGKGEGEGPGEFRTPVDIALADNGDVVVLDYGLARLIWFTAHGEFVKSLALTASRPLRFAMGGGRIWTVGSRDPGSTRPAIRVLDTLGTTVRSVRDFLPGEEAFGNSVAVTLDGDGNLLVAAGRPGLWMKFEADTLTPMGIDFKPELQPAEVDTDPAGGMMRIGMPQAANGAIGWYAKRVVLVHWEMDRPFDWNRPPTAADYRLYLSVFSESGDLIGQTTSWPVDINVSFSRFYLSPVTGHLFVEVQEPLPAVVELAIKTRIDNGVDD